MSSKQRTIPAMSIEQMFEDIPNSSFANPHMLSNKLSSEPSTEADQKDEVGKLHGKSHHGGMQKSARQAKSRNKVVKSGSEVKPHDFTGIFKTLDAANVIAKANIKSGTTAKGHHPKLSTHKMATKAPGLPEQSKSAEEAGARRGRKSGSTALQLDRMTPTTALAMFGSKLTQYERSEIKDFNDIYFMGLMAKKIGAEVAKVDSAIFDDDENFYKVVPRDHISYRYEVAEKPNLGKGTFGQVIKAFDHKERIFVALKLVRNERVYLKQAREELRVLQVLRKQDPNGFYNVVLIKEFFMFRNHMVIVFELLGMNLYQVLSKNGGRGLPMMKVLPIARGILKCLELLFKNRLIHCDLKPENIMLRRNGDLGSIKVGDFGSSCYEHQQVYHYIQSRYYRAPEVILGMRYGPAIDMWSFGCVLGELSTGNPLFMGSNEYDQLAAIEEVMGAIPKALIMKSTKFQDGITYNKTNRRGVPGSKQLANEIGGDETFKDLLSKILTLDPTQRPTPLELQDHIWLSKNRGQSNHSSVLNFSKHGSKS
ncbi:hypothetical protein RRG08_048828 [Elysia crispata]|uniref:dual-specificity kinase n=1 Tax=Elysia crispata TaxID=231223 RepID=A0AAE1E9K6_9GAST|nr:hypothetical protein RRG08_048828 [Elysia crispata]